MRFSKEAGNVKSVHSHKYSGLANKKVVDVSVDSTGERPVISFSTKSTKADQVSKSLATVPLNKNVRSSVKTLEKQAVGNYYRNDLKQATLAKFAGLYNATRVAKGVKKGMAINTGRK